MQYGVWVNVITAQEQMWLRVILMLILRMENMKYKAKDKVLIELDEQDANRFNTRGFTTVIFNKTQILQHIPHEEKEVMQYVDAEKPSEFKITKTGFYKLRNGEKYEVQCILHGWANYPVIGIYKGFLYQHEVNGRIFDMGCDKDIISEWVDEPEPEVQYISVYKNYYSSFAKDTVNAKAGSKAKDYKYTVKLTEWQDGKAEAEVIKL
jgi:hypothetical protein